jgi:enamine deaminase RidA (YjgF/YER057c/UK114 family)
MSLAARAPIARTRTPVTRTRAGSRTRALAIERLGVDEDAKYSQVVVHGETCYFAGQAELGDGIEAQTRRTLEECDRVLAMAGTDKTRLLSVTVWLKDMGDYAAFNEAYLEWIDGGHKPVRACVQSEMALPEYLVEIQMIAAKK